MTEKIKDGLHTEWYDNGHKKEEGTYKDGKKDGLWTDYYENGQKRSVKTYKDEELISQNCWDKDGSKTVCE